MARDAFLLLSSVAAPALTRCVTPLWQARDWRGAKKTRAPRFARLLPAAYNDARTAA